LIFNGATAYFKHEQGAAYVAYLLLNPPDQPIHALNLALKIRAASGADTELSDPIQQRNLGLDDAEAARVLRKKQLELEAIVDSEDPEITEPVKAEALSELEAIYTFQKSQAWRPRDAAQRAVRAVTMAIKRFHRHLASARDAHNQPHAVLRAFAQHIHDYILIPSGRGNGPGGSRLSGTNAGCFTYEPPPGVIWTT
jgi:hypothetical protein